MTYAPDDYALVIGIGDYPEWKKPLKSPKRDATKFHRWLVKPDGGGLPRENAYLMTSVEQSVIDESFRSIREQSKGKERRRFYFYFSGHGHSPAGSWQQSLCLPKWSPEDAGAALDLDSYVKSAIGCLKFSEAVFFLDCCRVRQVAPRGKPSDLECGDPKMEARHHAILYASDHYKPGYEGEVDNDGDGDQEVRGYFTTAMLNILEKETIELVQLVERLKVEVPELARPKSQTVRAVPTDKKIYLGPPGRKPPPAQERPETYSLTVELRTNLQLFSPTEQIPAPAPGKIVLLRGTTIVHNANGAFTGPFPAGDYQVQIVHGEASEIHQFQLDKDLVVAYDLPRRQSAALLSSTIEKREELTDPVVANSRWPAQIMHGFKQALFLSLRAQDRRDQQEFNGNLFVYSGSYRDEPVPVPLGNTLIPIKGDTEVRIAYHDPDGTTVNLCVPIADGWDTQIFIVLDKRGRPMLSNASVSMRAAGTGFDPSDALIDAYELAVADLTTGGPGPDALTLEALLDGKYRNPLYGLVGAHFLVRKLSVSTDQSPHDVELLDTVIVNLGNLLGRRSPDVVALRLRQAELFAFEKDIVEDAVSSLSSYVAPLLKPGLEAFIQATAFLDTRLLRSSPGRLSPWLANIAIGLDPDSPWACWQSKQRTYDLWASSRAIGLSSHDPFRFDLIESVWKNSGYVPEKQHQADRITLKGQRESDGDLSMYDQTRDMLTVPEWLVQYVRDADAQSERTGVASRMPAIVRRTGMPVDLILAARSLAQLQSSERGQLNDQNLTDDFDGGGKAA
ncbi:hypothetical protein ACVME8_009528 [Bradyrhizobium diazoefficiens]